MTNWDKVEELAKEYVRSLEAEQHHDADMDHHIMEAVLIAVFGDGIFDRINPLLDKYDA